MDSGVIIMDGTSTRADELLDGNMSLIVQTLSKNHYLAGAPVLLGTGRVCRAIKKSAFQFFSIFSQQKPNSIYKCTETTILKPFNF